MMQLAECGRVWPAELVDEHGIGRALRAGGQPPLSHVSYLVKVSGGGFEAGVSLAVFDRASDAVDVEAMLVAGQHQVDEAGTFSKGTGVGISIFITG